jgi:hypothetical protein
MKKAIVLLVLVGTVGMIRAGAQSKTTNGADYTTAAGLRLGYPFGVTVKHFIAPQGSVEGILGFWYGGINLTGLYEYHMDLSDVSGLKWFIGGGLDFTSWNHGGYKGGAAAIDGIVGLDYKIAQAPIDLSLDWKPAVYFAGVSGFYGSGGAISVRYTF